METFRCWRGQGTITAHHKTRDKNKTEPEDVDLRIVDDTQGQVGGKIVTPSDVTASLCTISHQSTQVTSSAVIRRRGQQKLLIIRGLNKLRR